VLLYVGLSKFVLDFGESNGNRGIDDAEWLWCVLSFWSSERFNVP
jgi:hypothetical protein